MLDRIIIYDLGYLQKGGEGQIEQIYVHISIIYPSCDYIFGKRTKYPWELSSNENSPSTST